MRKTDKMYLNVFIKNVIIVHLNITHNKNHNKITIKSQ